MHPGMFCWGDAFGLYPINYELLQNWPASLPILHTLFCADNLISIFLILVHFLYRYFCICKRDQMKWFTFPRSIVWVFAFLAFVGVFSTPIYIAFQPDQAHREYMKEFFQEAYGVDSYKIYFIIGRYFEDTPNGRVARWGDILTIANCVFMNAVVLVIIIYIFWKVYNALKGLDSTMSKRSKHLQIQFFRALTLQTLIPLITAFIPIGFFYACPFFGIKLGIYSNIVVVLLSFYPLLDGVVILLVVTDYRRAVIGMFFNEFNPQLSTNNRVDSTNQSDLLRSRRGHGTSSRTMQFLETFLP